MFNSIFSTYYYFLLLKKEREKKKKLENISIPSKSQQKCRICLKQGTVAIFGDGSTPDISEVVRKHGNIELNEVDNYPKHLCVTCLELLKGAVLFQRKAIESDGILWKQTNCAQKCKDYPLHKNFDENSFRTSLQTSYVNESLLRNINPETNRDNESLSFTEVPPKVSKAKTSQQFRVGDYYCAVYYDHKIIDENTKAETIVRTRDNSKLQCKRCNSVIVKGYAKYHLNVHRPSRKYMCETCGKAFKQRCTYYTHIRIHRTDFQFKCSKCPYRSNASADLRSHMRTHAGIYKYKCTECPKKFLFKSNLSRHNRSHKDPQFKCDYCNKSFYSKAYVQSHIEVLHLGHKDHVCEYCGAAFGFRKRMLEHQTEVHNRTKQPFGRTPLYLQAQIKDKEDNRQLVQ